MAGLGVYALGGALEGFGKGLAADIQMRREEALLRLKRSWQVEDRELAFKRSRSGRGGGGSAYSSSTVTGEDGVEYRMNKATGQMEPVMGADGKPFRRRGKPEDVPELTASQRNAIEKRFKDPITGDVDWDRADAYTAEIIPLMREGMDFDSALNDVARRENREKIPAKDGWFGTSWGAEPAREGEGTGTFRPRSSGFGRPGDPTRTGPQAPDQPDGDAADIPPAPRDPSQRVVGTRYMAPDGRIVEWTQKGWKLVQ